MWDNSSLPSPVLQSTMDEIEFVWMNSWILSEWMCILFWSFLLVWLKLRSSPPHIQGSPLSSSFPTATIISSFFLAFSIENLAAANEIFPRCGKYRNLIILGVRITHEVSSYYLGVSSLITTAEEWQQVVRSLDFEIRTRCLEDWNFLYFHFHRMSEWAGGEEEEEIWGAMVMAASIVAGQAGLALKPSLVAETRFSRRAPKHSDGLRGNRPAPSLASSLYSDSKLKSVCPTRGCGSKKNRWISILGESFLLIDFN